MTRPRLRRRLGWVVGAVFLVGVVGCASGGADDGAGAGAAHEGTIGLLLPESQTARYEASDHPTFVSVTDRRCPGCTVLYANAGQDAAAQLQQAESMLAQGADVLVLGAVDTVAAAGIVTQAERLGAQVIAYDRFLDGADYYVSYDYEFIGFLLGSALVGGIADRAADTTQGTTQGTTRDTARGRTDDRTDDGRPGVLLVHGSATEPNALAIAAGTRRALEGEDIDVLAEYYTPDWSPDKATEWTEAMLTRYPGQVDGILAANDGIAGGAIAAAKAAGLDPVPVTTGQDGELAAVQRILAGDQYMTVYKATDQQAQTAAELAVRLLRGEDPRATAVIDGVPTQLLAPRAVGAADVEHVIVDGRVYSTDEICVPAYVAACERAGLIGPDADADADAAPAPAPVPVPAREAAR
ncbi:D-xylose transport system substrate-binding protein [Promicromonospora umidemergens]|uniref:substrate-binding domain-containing protein n=1 Tax=Promicromonospora umidemergens TaxID=629679 RepID=UPI0020A358DE|nr:substrate-binding domain-containing protein [Promicromonospora umidemergens]MCP2282131.1 D-xylose transport system substrate-binding protein [Promicromonospora umidemergens]